MNYFYLLGTIIFSVAGQLVLKWRIAKYGVMPEQLSQKIIFLFRMLLDPFVILAFGFAFIASMLWIATMTKFEVSFAYPIIIASLLLITTVGGFLVLQEQVTMAKIVGPLLILVGVAILFVHR